MNSETSSVTAPEAAPLPSDAANGLPATAAKPTLARWALLCALLASGLAGWLVYETQRMQAGQAALLQRLNAAEQSLREQVAANQRLAAQDAQQLGRLNTLEGMAQRLQAEGRDLERARNALALLEVEQAIALAVQQVQLAGNVGVAERALRLADEQLARLAQPAHLPLRKALAQDIDRLSALPRVDQAGISLRLETLIQGIDQWPLAVDRRPRETAPETVPETPAQPWWQFGLKAFWQELRSLVRIQRFESGPVVLLSPEQAYFVREQLKLRLLNARLALFSRDEASFRNELSEAQTVLGRHFQADDPAVQAARSGLQLLATTRLNSEMPGLDGSQQALAALRQRKDAP